MLLAGKDKNKKYYSNTSILPFPQPAIIRFPRQVIHQIGEGPDSHSENDPSEGPEKSPGKKEYICFFQLVILFISY